MDSLRENRSLGDRMGTKRTALITGISGGLAKLVGEALHGMGIEIVGVDYRSLDAPLTFPATTYRANYNKTKIEDIFRRHQPHYVLHLGRVGNLKERMGKRFDLNVIGSRKVMELSQKYRVERLVVLSTFHIYGAHPHNHIPIFEDEPLRAGSDFPQIADAIQLDNQASLWVYRNPEVQTVLLRPCNVVGPNISNAISTFLRAQTVPIFVGFDPMVQFIHERDLTSAIVAAALGQTTGVFNVAGQGTIPWRTALALTGARQIPVPSSLAKAYLNLAGVFMPAFPSYLINFFKYPCIISDEAMRRSFDWQPRIGQTDAIRSLKKITTSEL